MVLNFLRFRQRPPGKTPPPNNRIDVFHDAETGKLVARDSQGNPVLFDSAGGSTNAESSLVVSPSGSNATRGTALRATYAAAKLLTPNGAVLSATNRAAVILPPGKYLLTAELALDTDFVDVFAQVPERGGDRLPTDIDEQLGANGGSPLSTFRPPRTLVYTNTALINVLHQTAADVRLTGFGVANLAVWETQDNLTGVAAFRVGNVNNAPSIYTQMYFWARTVENFFTSGCGCHGDFDGLWIDCIGNAYTFNIGKGTFTADFAEPGVADGEFRATMIRCQTGACGFIGDGVENAGNLHKATGCRMIDCEAIGGIGVLTNSGLNAFGGCGGIGSPIDSTCVFERCKSGPNSYGLGQVVAGTFRDCVGGNMSFGGGGKFTGTARNCTGGPGSFGGRTSVEDGNSNFSYNAGTLDNCECLAGSRPTNLRGAKIRGGRFTITSANQAAFRVFDSNSQVTGAEIVVVQGGTGIPFILGGPNGGITAFANAGGGEVLVTSSGHGLLAGDSITIAGTTSYNGTFTVAPVTGNTFKITDTFVANDATGTWTIAAKSIRVGQCLMNNAATDADGLGASLTNLLGTPVNVIDDDIV